MDQRTEQLLEEANRAGVSFLLTDLDTVLIFLKIAGDTGNDETRSRNRKQARDGYSAILRHLARLKPTPDERLILDEKLASVRSRLRAAGNPINP